MHTVGLEQVRQFGGHVWQAMMLTLKYCWEVQATQVPAVSWYPKRQLPHAVLLLQKVHPVVQFMQVLEAVSKY